MRIDSLWIGNFKNLKNVTIDFDQDHWITVVIGWNGTGKSNVLEALLTIFRDLVMGEDGTGNKNQPSFAFKLRYLCKGKWVHIDANPARKPGYIIHVSNEAAIDGGLGEELPVSKFLKDSLLPEYIFGYYSGESKRFGGLFEKYMSRYDKKLRAGEDPGLKRLFYALPVHSNFVLLSFIINDSELTKTFLKEQLGLEDGGIDSVLFVLRQPPWKSKEGDPRFWNAKGIVRDFLDRIYAISIAPIRVTRNTDESLWNKRTREFLYLYVKDLASLKEIAKDQSSHEFFRNIESTYVSELIEEVRIRVKLRKNDGSITFRELSEGEQQLLTVLGLLHFTSKEESLFLLDEPDTHLNPRWSVDYLKYLHQFVGSAAEKHNSSHVILTTHNPLAVAELEKEQVQILVRDQKSNEVSVQSPDMHPRGMGYAGIITSELFGLDSALDSHTAGLLEEKHILASKKGELTSEEKVALQGINAELETYGFRYEVRDPVYAEYLKARYMNGKPSEVPEMDREEQKLRAKKLVESALNVAEKKQ